MFKSRFYNKQNNTQLLEDMTFSLPMLNLIFPLFAVLDCQILRLTLEEEC